jgi:formylglycine-generating enzyme required for sulfatase activity
MRQPESFDVFLSHNSKDKPAVRKLATELRARRLRVWLDEDCLLPGELWQKGLERVIGTARAGAVLVGRDGFGPWEDMEMQALLSQFVRRGLPVIPILLAGAPQTPELPPFLAQFVWSDLRDGLTTEAIDRLVAGIRPRRNRRPAPDPLEQYRTWAAERYSGLSLIGLGSGDLGRLRFEDVYVPLSIVRRQEVMGAEEMRFGEGAQNDEIELEVEGVFKTSGASNPHVLLLGAPGAGKTMGLWKLLHRCLAADGPQALGIEPGMLPVFLRLRRFTPDSLDRPFEEFLQRELERELVPELSKRAKRKIPPDLGSRLWRHGGLLLLLDGLDEIADPVHRSRVCQFLDDWELSHRPHLRAVLTCRFSCYDDRVRLGDHFTPLEVRPLDTGQCSRLVKNWFRAAQLARPGALTKQEALKATANLIAALDGTGYGAQRWKVLVGSPLLLTLLCVIAYRGGGQMPKHRTAFYDQCLRVLLGSWSSERRADPVAILGDGGPPLDVETALAILRSIAWELHGRGAKGDLSVAELSLILRDCLDPQGRHVPARQVLEWLHREAGVLVDYGEHLYGLPHLGLQEYLTACHIASQGTNLLAQLCQHAGEKWWEEVFLLLAGLPGHGVFGPLMKELLDSPALLQQPEFLRACLEEAAQPDLGPFVDALTQGIASERQAAVLRLVRGRSDPRLEESVRALVESPDPDVRALAGQFLRELAAQRSGLAGRGSTVFVAHSPQELEAARELAEALRRQGWLAVVSGDENFWRADPEELAQTARGAFVMVRGGTDAPWEARELANCLKLLTRHGCPLFLAELSADRPSPPEYLDAVSSVDLSGGLSPAVLSELYRALADVPAVGMERTTGPLEAGAPREPMIEIVTGIRFVWIPGGWFEMGGAFQDEAKPVHLVRVSPFWLGEAPVTNAQYAKFMAATGSQEPRYWRDRRFSLPDQPVVGVSWDDAQAFCRWLETAWGRRVLLPTEAQWEFAARGTDGRAYPWGNEQPDATRACFGLDWQKGQPAPAGSYPAGRGPFGTLDQAGNSWDWCRDAWDERAYEKRVAQGGESLDPVVEGGAESERVVRGGGWAFPAGDLRSATRNKLPARFRLGNIGFRVASDLVRS